MTRSVRVLAALDGAAGDLEAVRRVLEKGFPGAEIKHLADGQAVHDYFFKNARRRGEVLLLDRRLPKRDALDLYTELRLDPRYDDLVVAFVVDSPREGQLLKNSFDCPSVRRPIERHAERLLALCRLVSR